MHRPRLLASLLSSVFIISFLLVATTLAEAEPQDGGIPIVIQEDATSQNTPPPDDFLNSPYEVPALGTTDPISGTMTHPESVEFITEYDPYEHNQPEPRSIPEIEARLIEDNSPAPPEAMPQLGNELLPRIHVPLVTSTGNSINLSEQAPDSQQEEEGAIPAAPLNTVYVSYASTANSGGVTKTSFVAGEAIKYLGYVTNTTGASRTAYFAWIRIGPCGTTTMWSGYLTTGTGTWVWALDRTTPTNCPGNYTFKLQATYNGQTTERSTNFTVTGGGSVTANSVRTADSSWTTKTSFVAGEAIKYIGYVTNTTGAARTAYFAWIRVGPCGTTTMWSGYLTTGTGTWGWTLDRTTPTNCPGNYTFKLQVIYNGQTTERSTYFTVTNGGSVTANSVRTADSSWTTKTSFVTGEQIRYIGYVANTTGASRTAYFAWIQIGPCGTTTMWAGYLTTGTGTWGWTLDRTTPTSCPGNYTFQLQVTYNGQTTSRSIGFTVNTQDIDYHMRDGAHVFKIDLHSSRLSFEVVMADDRTSVNYGKATNASPREYVSDMVTRSPYASRNPILAFNADYFGNNPQTQVPEHGPQGLTVKNGQRFDGVFANPPEADTDGNDWQWDSLSISRYAPRTSRMGKLTACNGANGECHNWWPTDAYYNTVGGGPVFIESGQRVGGLGTNSTEPCTRGEFYPYEMPLSYCTDSRPWTAVGKTLDGRYLIVVVSGSDKTMDEIARIMIAEQVWRAIKLDGGGSTQVWYKNTSPQSLVAGGRPVANALLVFATP